ncbi:MAG: DUF3365 domain-containing protein [Flavobacteriaceae bacterium]|jgi:outer membrane lipoprotein-sorting protein|nr:DUF3365 domain-containing protein [Flavobacteriaceae bacterium]
MRILLFILFLLFLVGCTNSKELSVSEKEDYLASGDSISNNAQMVLLSNVGRQIQQNGVVKAVDFCSEKAIFLTDSLSNKSIKIQRLSDKNRNPINALKSEIDKKAWNELQKNPDNQQLVLQENNTVYYYKSISIGMPTCLMCHGNKQTDISAETLEIINLKYPQDQAIGYKMGDFRGMWKIKF